MGGGGGGGVPFYVPSNQGGMDSQWNTLMQQQMSALQQQMGATGPALPALYQQLVGNLGSQAPGIENTAQQAAGYYGNMAGQADQFHNIMSGAGMADYGAQTGLNAAGANAWNTALDPQKALYGRTAQQVQDQSRAASSARGLGTSPYAAGLEDQSMSNFNIDWENQQLQRQLQGLAGLGQADKTAGQMGAAGSQELTGSQAMSGLAPQLLMQGAQLPYQTTAGLINQGFSNAGNYANALSGTELAPMGSLMSEIMGYLNFGQGASANQFGATMQELQGLGSLGGMFTNNYGMGPGQGMGILGSLFSNPFGGGGGGALASGAAGTGYGMDMLPGAVGFGTAGAMGGLGAMGAADAGAGAFSMMDFLPLLMA
jgi:hypothetical protein